MLVKSLDIRRAFVHRMLTPATGTLPPAATARKIAAFVGLPYNAPSGLKLRKTTKFQQKRSSGKSGIGRRSLRLHH
ncbi:uncharacterized protein LOC143899300 isoform X3 [Temnothorax americanus]|uniref:uncharacterized protein LOC143899300 isoform X3 n=1 Tax=Temnothorax americanus TaxID=1964332 RepID=UPI00406821E4